MKHLKTKYKVGLLVMSIAFILGLQSCIRRQFEVQVENRTSYSLDTVDFRMQNKDYSISLAQGQSSGIISTSYKFTLLNFFASGGLGMWVVKYSDNDSMYSNGIGAWWDTGDLSTKKVNKFIITESDNSPSNTGKFHIKLE
jgi:hypothetical protein